MRARHLPKLLFEDISELVAEPDFGQFDLFGGQKLRLVFLRKWQAVVGFTSCKVEVGVIAFFKVWRYSFDPGFVPDEFFRTYYDSPDFEIVGGPWYSGKNEPDLGMEIIETVEVKYNCNTHNAATFHLDDSFLSLIIWLQRKARYIQCEHKPKQLAYWTRLFSPKVNYLD
ncbi:MAG: hypothetical protein Q7S10_01195 [bacterium]|nr:hypothetical protein [bacterium]